MPILPPSGASPYDMVEAVLEWTRVRVNDAIKSIGGEVLTDVAPFTQTMTNMGWSRLQRNLDNLGFSRSTQEIIIPALPVTNTIDPAIFCFIDWTQYFDGTGYTPGLCLPPNLIVPKYIGERQTAVGGRFQEMLLAIDGMPQYYKSTSNRVWDWRNDKIYIPGSTVQMDLFIRFEGFMPDFVDTGNLHWYELPVPIFDCRDALSNFIAAEYAEPRSDLNAAAFRQKAEDAAGLIMNRDIRMKQRVNVRRIPRSYGAREYGNLDY